MKLVERDEPLTALGDWLGQARTGAGRMVLVAGEAGVGKTALLRAFCEAHADEARVWWGACDALTTPRPLGPLHDFARTGPRELAALMDADVPSFERLSGFLEVLRSPLEPTVAILEDVHLADEATRDLLVFVARRIVDVPALVVATYRDDEVGADHPLRDVLGAVATLPQVERLTLPLLSSEAVAAMVAGSGADAAEVHRVTGGNAFFVSEVLAAGDRTVPPTVADAVLARTRRLAPSARAMIESVAIVPDQTELGLVGELAGLSDADASLALEAGVATGMLELAGGSSGVRFRHELARRAVEGAISAMRRARLHATALGWLRTQSEADPARVVYHAEQARDREAILEYAPAAAAQAAQLGAHREAAAHYRLALGHANSLEPDGRAELLETLAGELSLIGEHHDCLDALDQALALRSSDGEVDQISLLQSRRSGMLWNLGRLDDARAAADHALALIAGRPPHPWHVRIHDGAAYLLMIERDCQAAVPLAERAVQLAEHFGDRVELVRALSTLGAAQRFVSPGRAEATARRALDVGREVGDDRGVAQTFNNMAVAVTELRDYPAAEGWLDEAMAWNAERDVDILRSICLSLRGRVAFEQGRWSQAVSLLEEVVDSPIPVASFFSRTQLGRLRSRQGDLAYEALLQDVRERSSERDALLWRWVAAGFEAEVLWLTRRSDEIPAVVDPVLDLAVGRDQPLAVGELAFWLWRAGRLRKPPDGAAEPFAAQIRGDWRAAAQAWEQLGCPYEMAVALADGDDPDELARAFEVLAGLGAAPMADRVAARLRQLGVHELPRRPRRMTVDNPGGLTARQLEVLGQLVAGRTDAQIAEALHISPKTVGHHVSAILGRLDVADRREAARVARERGLVQV